MKEQLNAIYEKAVESIKNAEQLKDRGVLACLGHDPVICRYTQKSKVNA